MSNQKTPVAEKLSFKERYFNLYNKKYVCRGEKYHLGETTVAYTLLLPTIITLILLFVLPLIILLVLSVNDFRVTRVFWTSTALRTSSICLRQISSGRL